VCWRVFVSENRLAGLICTAFALYGTGNISEIPFAQYLILYRHFSIIVPKMI
jgi:hypothetical protein